jgi:uncharacterized membrane protein
MHGLSGGSRPRPHPSQKSESEVSSLSYPRNLLNPGFLHTSTTDNDDFSEIALPLSSRLTRRIVHNYGSWPTVWIYINFIIMWAGINLFPSLHHFDGYPFPFLSLLLTISASIAPIFILMNQNQMLLRDQAMVKLNAQAAFRMEAHLLATQVLLGEALEFQGKEKLRPHDDTDPPPDFIHPKEEEL